MIVLLHKSKTNHPAQAQAPLHLPHTLFGDNKNLTNPSPCSCMFEVAQSLPKNNMLGANTRSVSARFRHVSNWEKGKDFINVKTCHIKKQVGERWEHKRVLDDAFGIILVSGKIEI